MANVSLSQGSLSKLVECLLGPSDSGMAEQLVKAEREEAVIT